jgi:hypothetical protein
MTPDEFAGFDLDDVRRKVELAEAERKRAEEEARRNAEKKPKVVPVAAPVVGAPGLGDIAEDCSIDKLDHPQAVLYASQNNCILQSLGESVFARDKWNDKESWDSQHTRTGAFYVVENDKAYVAFDDIPVNNIILRDSKEGYDAAEQGGTLIIRGRDLESVLERAKDAHRFLRVPEDSTIRASVVGIPCEYERNPYFVAALGQVMASVNAELIKNRGKAVGRIYLLDAPAILKTLSFVHGSQDCFVCPVMLCGDSNPKPDPNADVDSSVDIDAEASFTHLARARRIHYLGGAQ